ncbi:MAG: hypothetical protein ABI651_06880 [Verrucomicrobiota bacterium]
MKISLALGPRRPLDRATAWACVMANQATLPGVGSLAAGRRVGYGQVALGLIGVVPMLAFSVRLLLAAYRVQQTVGSFGSPDELMEYLQQGLRDVPHTWGLYFWIGLPGAALFIIAWFWALASSLSILLESRKETSRS